MTIKDWIFLVLGITGTFSFGYTVGRQSVWSDVSDVMDILAGYSGSAKKEKRKE